MQPRRLGQTDIEISPLGLGCWQLSEGRGLAGFFWEALSPELTREIVAACIAGGITWYDTAEAYGNGRSERALARALRANGKQNGDVVIATKWLPAPLRTAGSIAGTLEKRLECLDGFSIDLHQVHHPLGSLSSLSAQMKAMARLVGEGRIKSVGVSNFNAKQMRHCHHVLADHGVPLASNQVNYSLLHRGIESDGVLDTAEELGITIIAYSPLAQGLLSGKFHRDPDLIKRRVGPRKYLPKFRRSGLGKSRPVIDALNETADHHGVTPAQVALNWVVTARGQTVVAIPGASKVRHVEDNVAALGFELTADERTRLHAASARFR